MGNDELVKDFWAKVNPDRNSAKYEVVIRDRETGEIRHEGMHNGVFFVGTDMEKHETFELGIATNIYDHVTVLLTAGLVVEKLLQENKKLAEIAEVVAPLLAESRKEVEAERMRDE